VPAGIFALNPDEIASRRRVSFSDAGFVGDGCPLADVDLSPTVGLGNFNAGVSISRQR
jgi:hypothetical protein